jgi:hypothetical protein
VCDMARRFGDDGQLPWPKDLAEYDPTRWPDRRAWHSARAKVARSLGRSALPEVRAMTRVNRHGRNGKVL